jgi:signal transduction histidine kinase
MILMGTIVFLALAALLTTATVTNKRVEDDVVLTESRMRMNKMLLEQLHIVDNIQITQNRLIKYAKDAIIAKDEIAIDKERFHNIEQEAASLLKYLRQLQFSISNTEEDSGSEAILQEYTADIESVKEFAEVLIQGIKENLRKAIEERHRRITRIEDEFMRIEGLLGVYTEDMASHLAAHENLLQKRLKAEGPESVYKEHISTRIEVIGRLRMALFRLVSEATTAIAYQGKGYIDDKRIAIINENMNYLHEHLPDLETLFETSEENLHFTELAASLSELTTLIQENLIQTVERAANERGQIEIDFLRLDAELSGYADAIHERLTVLGRKMRTEVSAAGDALTMAQDELTHQVKRTFQLSWLIAIGAIAIVSLLFTLFANSLITPISEAVRLANGIQRGDFSLRLHLQRNDEIGQLAHALDNMAVQLDEYTKSLALKNTTLKLEIEERKRVEEELREYREHLEILVRQRTQELEEAQAQLIRKERLSALGQLAATVAHEIRNPLATIRTSVFMIGDAIERNEMGRIDRAIELTERNITRCDMIITELLDYTRERDLHVKPTDIDCWLEKLLSEHVIPEEIICTKDFRTGISTPIDGEYLRRAIINVLDNAIDALRDENSQGNQLTVSTHVLENRLEIRFSDNGCGIPEDQVEKLFEPLFSTKSFGVGLGMSIVKNVIEQHGGGIEIQSTESKGTTITLWLPLTTDPE